MPIDYIKAAERNAKEHIIYKKVPEFMIIYAKNSNFSGHLKLLRQSKMQKILKKGFHSPQFILRFTEMVLKV